MKKRLFGNIKYVIAFVLGAIFFSALGVKAATVLTASEVAYDNSNSSLQATNVQAALDELYQKAANKEKLCKKGYYTTSDGSSNYTCTKIGDNESVITITVNGPGAIRFLSNYYRGIMPNYVYVDGTSITPVKAYNFETGNHTIVLKWSNSVQDTSYMFSDCSRLTSLDLSNFDTSNVTNMYAMFQGCSSLTNLDLSNFDFSNVEDMNSMFTGCASGLQVKATSAACIKVEATFTDDSYTCTQ